MERTIHPDELKSRLSDMYILDARRASDREASDAQLPDAHWKDPEQLSDWAHELPKDKNIVLYCVRGGSISNSVVDALRSLGFRARYIEGGIDGWKAAGGTTVPRSE